MEVVGVRWQGCEVLPPSQIRTLGVYYFLFNTSQIKFSIFEINVPYLKMAPSFILTIGQVESDVLVKIAKVN